MSISKPYQLFCTERYPLPTEEDILKLEKRIKIKLPSDFRDYLLKYNGGSFREYPYLPVPLDEEDDAVLDVLSDAALDTLKGVGASVYNESIGEPYPSSEFGADSDLSLFYYDMEPPDPPEILPFGRTIQGYMIYVVVAAEAFEGEYLYGEIFLKTFDDHFHLAKGIEEFFEHLGEVPKSNGVQESLPDFKPAYSFRHLITLFLLLPIMLGLGIGSLFIANPKNIIVLLSPLFFAPFAIIAWTSSVRRIRFSSETFFVDRFFLPSREFAYQDVIDIRRTFIRTKSGIHFMP